MLHCQPTNSPYVHVGIMIIIIFLNGRLLFFKKKKQKNKTKQKLEFAVEKIFPDHLKNVYIGQFFEGYLDGIGYSDYSARKHVFRYHSL